MNKSITSNQIQLTPVKFPYDCTQASPWYILRPLPKVPPQKKTRVNNRKRKCPILMNTPEKNALERQQIEKVKRKRKPSAKQPIKRKGWKTSKNIKSKKNSSSLEDAACLICFDSCLESKNMKTAFTTLCARTGSI